MMRSTRLFGLLAWLAWLTWQAFESVAFAAPTPHMRKLNELYARRAYYGAPPTIPHPVEAATLNDPSRCLVCHVEPMFAPTLQAFAPTTPHPEFAACTQCHVPRGNLAPFRQSEFTGLLAPTLSGGALATSPPQIPHRLEMRRACAACHTTAATAAEIFCKHPERASCEQCHVQSNFSDPHFNPASGGGS